MSYSDWLVYKRGVACSMFLDRDLLSTLLQGDENQMVDAEQNRNNSLKIHDGK